MRERYEVTLTYLLNILKWWYLDILSFIRKTNAAPSSFCSTNSSQTEASCYLVSNSWTRYGRESSSVAKALAMCLRVNRKLTLTHHHIEYHHKHETDGKANGTEIGVLTVGGFGYQFLDYNVKHSSSGECQHIGHNWHQ